MSTIKLRYNHTTGPHVFSDKFFCDKNLIKIIVNINYLITLILSTCISK